MRRVRYIPLFAWLAIAGCADSHRPVEVRITPDTYRVGDVESALATPAVDEMVRMGPRKVLMVACRGIRPAKIIQFERELRARIDMELTMTFVDQGCSPS